MVLRIIAFGALAAIGAAVLLPAGDGLPARTAFAGTAAEVELIASLRELAQVPEGIEEVRVALLPPDPGPQVIASSATAAETEVSGEAAERLVVASEALNLRSGPSIGAEVLGRLLMGEAVAVEAREGGWVQVATADGVTGWAYGDYLMPEAN